MQYVGSVQKEMYI